MRWKVTSSSSETKFLNNSSHPAKGNRKGRVRKTADCSSPECPENGRSRSAAMPPRRRPDRLCDVGAATPTIELEGDQLGELGRDHFHRLFYSAQAASRAEQGANFAESFIRRVVDDGNEQVTR